jgi:hypothetical protein
MHLYRVNDCQTSRDASLTHEPSETEMMRGARREDLLAELWEPLDVVEERPCILVSKRLGWCRIYTHSCYSA